MIVTFSLQKRLKNANLWQAEDYTEEDEEDEKQTSDDSENLLGKGTKLDSNALSAEEQRKIEQRQRIEERKRKRILEEREMESKISGISIYSVYYAENDLKIVPIC